MKKIPIPTEEKKYEHTIIIDTREQKPYTFKKYNTIKKTMKTGDYALEGHEECLVIERKSSADYDGSITNGRERLEKEIIRAQERGLTFYFLLETDLTKMWKPSRYSKVYPTTRISTSISWMEKYKHLKTIYASNRTQGKYFVEKIFEHHIRHCKKSDKNITKNNEVTK